MKENRFRVVASANSYERLPNGNAPSFDVLNPPSRFVARYKGVMCLDFSQMREAQQELTAVRYKFDAGKRAWVGPNVEANRIAAPVDEQQKN